MDPSAIFAPVQQEMLLVERSLREVGRIDYPLLAALVEHILSNGGKRIRPALTLLAAKAYRDDLGLVIPMATAVELLHTATLVHDDAIDNASLRRGKATLNSLWGDRGAILVGDYLFARSAELVASVGDLRVIRHFARTLMAICSGELQQGFSSRSEEQREGYFQRISNKTASLFTMAAESGGVLSGAPEQATAALSSYGHNLGMASQIVDDILDFTGEGEEIGKPVGSDLLQGTLTLPSIVLMEQRPHDNPIARILEHAGSEQDVGLAIEMVRNSSVIPECYRIAEEYAFGARAALAALPDNACRNSLHHLVDYVVQRKK